MNCQQIETLLVPQLDGELAPDESAEVTAHLEGCADCRARLAFLQQSAAWLDSALGYEIVAEVSKTPVHTPEIPRSTPMKSTHRFAIAASLLLMVAGTLMVLLRQRSDEPPVVAWVGSSDRKKGAKQTAQSEKDLKEYMEWRAKNRQGPVILEVEKGMKSAIRPRGGTPGVSINAENSPRQVSPPASKRPARDPSEREPNKTTDNEEFQERDERKDDDGDRGGGGGDGRDAIMRRIGGERSGKKQADKPKAWKTWKRSLLVPNTSKLMVGNKESLPLKAMQIAVKIDAFRARVLIDFYFHNNRAQQLEGTFKLRLPNGASPYFLAFGETVWKSAKPEIASTGEVSLAGDAPSQILARRKTSWLAPKVARMVAKQKAADAYDRTVKGQVDPALMEWSGAGVFSARIFPIAANKLYRVVIGYDVDLISIGQAREFRLDLPEGLPRLAIDLGVAQPRGTTVTVKPKGLKHETADRIWYRFDDPDIRSIQVRLTGPSAPLLIGLDKQTSDYFAARFEPKLPQDKGSGGAARAVFMLDTSLSGNPVRFNVWLKILEALIERNRGTMKQFALLCFNVEAFWYKDGFIDNTPANLKALKKWCRRLALEGATNLRPALAEAVRPSWLKVKTAPAPHDLFLLSDGAVTWGDGDAHQLGRVLRSGFAGPLFAYTTGFSGTDTRMLTQLTRVSQGAVFSVTGESEIAKVATAHSKRPWRLVRIGLAGCKDLLLAGRPRNIFPGQRLLLVGRGTPKKNAVVELRVRRGNVARTLRIQLAAPLRSELTPRVYGQVAVNELETLGRATVKLSVPYARHFRVTGKSCSLLMLESKADYKRFKIKPEMDAFVVSKSPAVKAIGQAVDTVGDELGNAKKNFLAYLKRLEGGNRPKVVLDQAFHTALETLPESAFVVSAKRLSCKQRTWKGIPGNLTEQLASRKLDYDAITAESDRRLLKYGKHDALKALSSLVENRPGDLVLARDVCLQAMEWELGGQAFHTLRRVARARPWEPMTYHAMATCLTQIKQTELAMAYYEIGLAGNWDDRYGAFRRILGLEYLNLLRKISRGEVESRLADYAKARISAIARMFPLKSADLVITITWNTDSTDIDLHVVEPTGERCYYSHRKTRIGGELTQDVTQGYGPEMYVLKKAMPGNYSVQAKFYRGNRNRASARTKVYATIYRHWGTPEETVTHKVIVLRKVSKMYELMRQLTFK